MISVLAKSPLLSTSLRRAAPTAGTVAETSIGLSWSAVSNTSKYRVEYRECASRGVGRR